MSDVLHTRENRLDHEQIRILEILFPADSTSGEEYSESDEYVTFALPINNEQAALLVLENVAKIGDRVDDRHFIFDTSLNPDIVPIGKRPNIKPGTNVLITYVNHVSRVAVRTPDGQLFIIVDVDIRFVPGPETNPSE